MIKVVHLLGGGIMCGAGEYALRLAGGLADKGFSCTLATLKDGPLVVHARRRGVEAIVLNKQFPADVTVIPKLAWILRKEGASLLHTHTANSHLYGRPAAWITPGCKLVSTEHAFITDVYKKSAGLIVASVLDRYMARHIDRHIAVSEAMKRALVKSGLAADNIVVIPNGIDPNEYCPEAHHMSEAKKELGVPHDAIVIGTMGRLTKVKNHELLIRCAKKLLEHRLRAHVVIAGDGPRLGHLKAFSTRAGVGEFVHFLGWRTDLPRVLAAMDIFALSSYSEVAPFSVLQAMAMEKPVVATAVGGIPEIVEDGVTGYLVPSDATEAFADALIQLINNQALRAHMGAMGRRRVTQCFSEQAMLERTAQVYRDVLGIH